MAEKTTIARPYAEAIFALAKEKQELVQWSEMLAVIAQVVADDQVRGLIGNPRVQKSQLAELVQGVAGDKLNETGGNLVKLLADNGRLAVMPEIAALFEGLRAEAESTVEAKVYAAFEISEAQQKQIAKALKKRLGREVSLTCEKDENLLGGAIIRAGDLVIDGSVTGQLAKLGTSLAR